MPRDYYDVLGVSKNASDDEIKKAYREKARKFHPDTSDRDDAKEKFKEVQKAYEVLSDDEKREAYDSMGHERFKGAQKQGFDPGEGGGFGGLGGKGGGGFESAGFENIEDIFDMFGGMGGGGFGRSESRGNEIKTNVTVSLKEAYEGVEREISYRTKTECAACDGRGAANPDDVHTCSGCGGSGKVQQQQRTPFGRQTTVTRCPRCKGRGKEIEDECRECGGTGEVTERVTRVIDIPPGVENGTTLRMRDGDDIVYIEVRVREHDKFERDGADIYYTHPISFPQAVFGDSIQVPTLEGEVKMEVPKGTRSGEQFRLRGKGMPIMDRRNRKGDQYVRVKIITPEPGDLDEEEREALEKFAELGGDEIEFDEGIFEKLKDVFN
ncbi:MAG: molecular chaperone DnaJ [Halobacteria archaeon]